MMENVVRAGNNKATNGLQIEREELIKVLVNLANKAYFQGLLSLEENVSSLQPSLLKKGVEMMIEGYGENKLITLLDPDVQGKANTELNLLESTLIRTALLLMQKGESGDTVLENLLSGLRENNIVDFDYASIEEQQYLENYSRLDSTNHTTDFERRMMCISSANEMHHLTRKVGYFVLAYALKGTDSKVRNHVKNLMNAKSIWQEIDETMKKVGPCLLQDTEAAQKFILGSFHYQ